MMMPMEDIPSPRTAGESDSEESSSQDEPDIKKKNNNRQETSNNETSWNLCCCTGGSSQGISRNKIQPVIFQPNNDLYLQLKPHRRIRVIHINGQGAMPTPTPYYLQSSGDSDDDEEYWFQNADPKRPKITQPPPAKNLPKRIFHKLEPQVRPTLEQLSPSSLLNNSIQGRLPRKTIAKDALAGLNNDDDIDEEDILEKPVVRSSENSPASLKRNNINIKSGQPDLHGVITLPEHGESSTDHNDEIDGANPDDPDYPGDKDAGSDNESAQSDSNVTATIEEAGQKLESTALRKRKASSDAEFLQESKISKTDPKTCPTCGKNFTRPQDVKRHISSVHEKNKPFQCDHCKHCSTNKSALNRHIQDKHMEDKDKPYKCQFCTRGFTQKGRWTAHESECQEKKSDSN